MLKALTQIIDIIKSKIFAFFALCWERDFITPIIILGLPYTINTTDGTKKDITLEFPDDNFRIGNNIYKTFYWSFKEESNIGFYQTTDLWDHHLSDLNSTKIYHSGVCIPASFDDKRTQMLTFQGMTNYIEYIFNNNSYYTDYSILFIAFINAFLFVSLLSVISRIYIENANFVNPLEQVSSYECGFTPFGSLDKPQLFLFYKLAIFFIIFEAELIFLYPWVISLFSHIGSKGVFFISSFPFFAVICFGFYYEIDEEALEI